MNNAIDISIVVPTYNRKRSLQRCLGSLFEQDYPGEKFEVIVVDDGFDTEIIKTMEDLRKFRSNVRYFNQYQKGPACARNLGIEVASGNIIGFIDDDCVVHKDWVKLMVESHQRNINIVAVGGITFTSTRETPVLVSQFLSSCSIQTHINGRKETIFFPTCNVSFKRWVLKEHKFDDKFPLPGGEDLELFWRLFKHGHRFIWNKDIKVVHYRDSTLGGFLKQAYIYGRGNLLVQHIHKDHPLLKELKTGKISFWIANLINTIKIPRFSYLLGRRLIRSWNNFTFYKRFQIYLYFALHKVMYLIGNITEYYRIQEISYRVFQGTSERIKEIYERPEFIILDITHRCNLKCNICEIRKDKPIEEFTTDEVKDLIMQSIKWGVEEFVLSGGEPFVREDIFEILDFVKEKKYHIGILTNGILLNEELIRRLLPYLISNTLSLSISLDALTPEIHDNIRGAKGCFERTFNGLKILSEFKRNADINFNTISIILNENLEELLPLANLLKSLNVNSIQFQPLLANNLIMKERSSRGKYWIPQERLTVLDQAVDSLIEFKKNNLRIVQNSENNLYLIKKYFRGLLTHEDIKCLYATKTMLIANNGDVTTCFDCYGSVRKVSLREIFKSKEAEQARQKVSICKNPCLLPCFCD